MSLRASCSSFGLSLKHSCRKLTQSNHRIVTPILYFTNAFYVGYLPISSRTSYDNTGARYNVTAILNPDLTLNVAQYKAYSPLFLSATFALTYGLSFASITATLVHAFLYFRKQIWVHSRRSLSEQPDIHAKLMSKYRQVPDWYVSYSLSISSSPRLRLFHRDALRANHVVKVVCGDLRHYVCLRYPQYWYVWFRPYSVMR